MPSAPRPAPRVQEPKPRRARKWLGQALTALASLLVCLVVAELALHWTVGDYPQFYAVDPLVGWKPRPDVEGWYPAEQDAYLQMNHAGFRDVDHPVDKPPGTYRIAILGDSMTESVEEPLDEVYWKRLEGLLSSCPGLGGRRVESISFAVNGYGTAQEYLTLKGSAARYYPDLVLLAFFTGNDFADNNQALGRHRDRPYFALRDGHLQLIRTAADNPGYAWRRRWLELRYVTLDRLRLVQLARRAGSGFQAWRRGSRPGGDQLEQPGLDTAIFSPPATPDWQEAWRVTEALILAVADTARAQGAAFAMTTLTNPLQVMPNLTDRESLGRRLGVADLTYPDRRLAEFAAANGLTDVSLVEPLAAYAAEHHAALHGRDPQRPLGHWNELGQRLAAEHLAQGLCGALTAGALAPPSH